VFFNLRSHEMERCVILQGPALSRDSSAQQWPTTAGTLRKISSFWWVNPLCGVLEGRDAIQRGETG